MRKTQSNESVMVIKVDGKSRPKWVLTHVLSSTTEEVVICAILIGVYELVKLGVDWFWDWLGFELGGWQAPATILVLIIFGSFIVYFFDAKKEWGRRVRRIAEVDAERANREASEKRWEQLSVGAAQLLHRYHAPDDSCEEQDVVPTVIADTDGDPPRE